MQPSQIFAKCLFISISCAENREIPYKWLCHIPSTQKSGCSCMTCLHCSVSFGPSKRKLPALQPSKSGGYTAFSTRYIPLLFSPSRIPPTSNRCPLSLRASNISERAVWETHITEYGKAENIRIHCKAYWKCSATAELADIPYCDNSGTQRHHCEK